MWAENGRLRWTRLRRLSQVATLLLFVALPVTYLRGQIEVMGTLASLRLGPISLVDPASGLATIIAAREASWTLLGGMLLPIGLALALGPVFCAWVCPWGLLSELLARLLRRPMRRKLPWLRPLRWSALAVVLAGGLATGVPLAATVSAPRLMTVLPLEIIFLGGATAGSVGLLAAVFVLELVLPRRLWCRALCPVGSVLVLLRVPWTLGVGWTEATCRPALEGALCVRSCPWGLDPRSLKPLDGCTNCGLCVEHCPAGPSLAFGFSRPRGQS